MSSFYLAAVYIVSLKQSEVFSCEDTHIIKSQL